MKRFILGILVVFFLFSCVKKEPAYKPLQAINATTGSEINDLSIMSFNIQVFGKSKSSKHNVMETIIDIIDDYDLIAIQEIRDASNTTLTRLMSMMPDNYKLVAGPRDGRSSSKEQAIYVYNDSKLDVVWKKSYADVNDVFERSPFMVYFKEDNKKLSFIMVNVHIQPKSAEQEIHSLSKLISKVFELYKDQIILVGDFNSDGNYFNEKELNSLFPSNKYDIIINNKLNTTVATKDNTYDRIIITDGLENRVLNSGVLYFKKYLVGDTTLKQVSDHYPVYMILKY